MKNIMDEFVVDFEVDFDVNSPSKRKEKTEPEKNIKEKLSERDVPVAQIQIVEV